MITIYQLHAMTRDEKPVRHVATHNSDVRAQLLLQLSHKNLRLTVTYTPGSNEKHNKTMCVLVTAPQEEKSLQCVKIGSNLY